MLHYHPTLVLKGEEEDANAIVTKALADLQKSVDDRLKAVEEKAIDPKLASRLDALETKMARPAIVKGNEPAEPTVEQKAFRSFLRLGEQRMPAEEAKALIVADDTRGGYLAPAEFSTEVIKNIVQFSPIRQAARIGATSSSSVILPKRTGTPTASWVGETETRTGTESAYGQVEIPVHEMAAYVDVSLQLLEDAAINVESEVAMDLAEEFGRLEGVAFSSGDGVKKPFGLMSDTNVAFSVSGSAATIADADGQANGLIDAFYALSPFYRNRAVWLMNGTTLASVRKLKDSSKSYIWQPGIQAGEPGTILGRPVLEDPTMPSEGAGLFPIALGDFDSAFRIYDRVGMSILRDPYSLATTGKVRFHARRRVGAGLTKIEALRKVKCATS